MDVLKHKSFLEELLFWTIKYEFPQKMVTFLLNMLPDQEYKVSTFFPFLSELCSPFFAFSLWKNFLVCFSAVAYFIVALRTDITLIKSISFFCCQTGFAQKAQDHSSEAKQLYRAEFLRIVFLHGTWSKENAGGQRHNCTSKCVVTYCSKFSKGEVQGTMRMFKGATEFGLWG